MSNAVQVAKIVEAALAGDAQKVENYAALIAEHFEQEGDQRSARIVRRSYGAEPAGRPVALDELPPLSTPPPCIKAMCIGPDSGTLTLPLAPYSGDFTGSACGDLQQHDY